MKTSLTKKVFLTVMLLGGIILIPNLSNNASAQTGYYILEEVEIVAHVNSGGGSGPTFIGLGPILSYDPTYGSVTPTWGTNLDPTFGGSSSGGNTGNTSAGNRSNSPTHTI